MLNPAFIWLAVLALLNGTPLTVASQVSSKPPFTSCLNNLNWTAPLNFLFILLSKISTLVFINSSPRNTSPSSWAILLATSFSSCSSSDILAFNLTLLSCLANLLFKDDSVTVSSFFFSSNSELSTVVEELSFSWTFSIVFCISSIPSNFGSGSTKLSISFLIS